MKTITVITNFNQLEKESRTKIFEDLGSFLALAYLEQLKVLPIDSVDQAATLQLNTNYDNNFPNNTPQSRKLHSSPNESYQANQKPNNNILPINEINKFSELTEGQNKGEYCP